MGGGNAYPYPGEGAWANHAGDCVEVTHGYAGAGEELIRERQDEGVVLFAPGGAAVLEKEFAARGERYGENLPRAVQ